MQEMFKQADLIITIHKPMKPLDKLIEIIETKRELAVWAHASQEELQMLDSILEEANEIAKEDKFPDNMSTKVHLRSGNMFDYANPSAEDIVIEDIARGLATEFRFAGMTPEPYSVAQHSVYCSLEPGTTKEKLERLLHDAPEFIMKDIPKPLKNLLRDYQVIEDRVTKVINEKFGIPYPLSESCHAVDKKIFEWEYSGMMLGFYEIEYWSVKQAEDMFLERYNDLTVKLYNELRQLEAGNS